MDGEEKINEDFLPELKYTFEQDLNWKNSLDSKASNMITMSSAITTLLTAVVTFLFGRITVNNSLYPWIIFILLGAIISAIVAILFFIRSYSIKDYRFAVGHEAFFENGEYNKTIVKEFLSYSKKRFNEHLIEEYLKCIKMNSANNAGKAANIKLGQYFYLGSISAIILILGIIIISSLLCNNTICLK